MCFVFVSLCWLPPAAAGEKHEQAYWTQVPQEPQASREAMPPCISRALVLQQPARIEVCSLVRPQVFKPVAQIL